MAGQGYIVVDRWVGGCMNRMEIIFMEFFFPFFPIQFHIVPLVPELILVPQNWELIVQFQIQNIGTGALELPVQFQLFGTSSAVPELYCSITNRQLHRVQFTFPSLDPSPRLARCLS
jgi:hypothetical protein